MKKTIIISTLILGILIFSQEVILPLNTSILDAPDNAYIKDIDSELDYFVGTWSVNWDNKTTLFTFEKKKDNLGGRNTYYKDILIGKFITTDSNGNVIEETNFNTDGKEKLRGLTLYQNRYSFSYLDWNNNCLTNYWFEIKKIAGNPNQLYWKNVKIPLCNGEINTECANISINIPKTTVILTKVP